jgi:hypothetical protein
MKIRLLNEAGLEAFNEYLFKLNNKIDVPVPYYLLNDNESSELCELDIELDKRLFETRFELGCYLVEIFKGKTMQPYNGHIGLWSWLALYWFDQLCPKKDDKHISREKPNFILSKNYNHRPRHSVFMTWQLVSKYGEVVKYLMSKEPSVRGEITEILMGTQEILSSQGVMELASTLYSAEEGRGFKKGAGGRGPGTSGRLTKWLGQIKRTYDVNSMTQAELFLLLPKEFEKFQS